MQPGKRLQQYVLIEQVGQGGQAAVWSAQDEMLKRTVAIKTINLAAATTNAEMGTPDQQAQRFVTEARTIAELEHPYILPVYTYGQEEGWLYIVMRYMAGGTLRKLIGKAGVPLSEALKLAAPLADALDQAHQKQIVHRDIKSVNVLLDSQRRPYLADFGLSVTVGDPSSQSGSGTLAYMSPEQLRGEIADHRSDLYSFATLVYEMLVGETPESGGSHWNIAQLTSNAPLPIPPGIAEPVAAVLRKGMALDPIDRYTSATALVESLRDTQQSERAPAASDFADGFMLTLDGFDSGATGADDFGLQLLPINDPALLALNKANDLFNTALNEWADGAGRFRLYSDDYKFIDSFYGATDSAGLDLTDAGKRLMLRTALEHDFKVEHWWTAVTNTADRRSVALQTLSSDIPASRLRAIELLTLLEDSNPPAIPIRVATIISRDPDPGVREAGVILLQERATPATAWRRTAYNAIIDDVLATLAAQDADPGVLEQAARTIGRLRTTHAAVYVAERAAEDPRALHALTLLRDEAGSYPPGIDAAVRRQSFVQLTLAQLFEHPLRLLYRYLSITSGFALGIGIFTYSTLFVQGASGLGLGVLANAVLNVGVTYGVLFALAVFIALEPAHRLRAWGRLPRVGLPLLAGGLLSMLVFLIFRTTYNNIPDPLVTPLAFFGAAFIMPAGFALVALLPDRPLLRSLAGAFTVWLALFGNYALCMAQAASAGDAVSGYSSTDYLFYLDPTSAFRSFVYALWIALAVGFLSWLPEWNRAARRWSGRRNVAWRNVRG